MRDAALHQPGWLGATRTHGGAAKRRCQGNAGAKETSVPRKRHSAAAPLIRLRCGVALPRSPRRRGSGIAKAIDYSLKRWNALQRYAHSGHLPIDNNPIENVIRPIVLGRKNWLFAGSELAGKRAAAIQTLLATAKINGLEPSAWLKQILERLPTWPHSRLDELLPLRSPV